MLRDTLVLVMLMGSLFLGACYSDPEKNFSKDPPLSQEKMAEVMTGFSLAEAAINVHSIQMHKNIADSAIQFNVLRQLKIEKKLFHSAMNWYTHHPAEFKLVYQRVVERLDSIKKVSLSTSR